MTAVERLVKYYKDSYKKLLDKISKLPPGASWEGFYRRLLKEIKKTVEDLDKAAAKELAEIVKRAYTAAEAKALEAIQAGPFGGLNRNAMWLVAENAVDDLVNANHYFGRHLEDVFRQIGLDAIAEKLSTGQTVLEAKRRIIEMLESEGLTAMVDSAGRRHRLETYAELVSRTTTREATNTATTETGRQLGYDLVKFSVHYPTCEVCAPVQGRVFSVSGKDTRFPALSSVPGFDKGFKTIHPNCRHVLVISVEALWTDEERKKYLADADKPVRGDTRTQEEVDRYNAMQAEKRERWQDRRQYERYRARLGDEAPKTFSAFRAIKRANGQKWTDMQNTYREWLYVQDYDDILSYRGTLSNYQARRWYKAHVQGITRLINPHQPLELQARQAFELRNLYRSQARELMADRNQARELEIRHPNRTFEEMLEYKKRKYGLTGDDAYRDIIKSALTTNEEVDATFQSGEEE